MDARSPASDNRRPGALVVTRLLAPQVERCLRAIQEHGKELTSLYPYHWLWVDKTIKAVERGERVAFVAWEEGETSRELVGSIVLKLSQFSEKVELKNLLVKSPTRLDAQASVIQVQHELLEASERYCAMKGFLSLVMELAPSQRPQIALLLDRGYTIASRVNSRYKPGDFFYRVERHLTPMYVGDPFHLDSKVRWILDTVYPEFRWKPTRHSPQLYINPNGLRKYELTLPKRPVALNEILQRKCSLRGICLVGSPAALFRTEPVASLETITRGVAKTVGTDEPTSNVVRKAPELPDFQFALLFSTEEPEADFDDILPPNQRLFGPSDIKALLGVHGTDAREIPFTKSDIGGMVVSVSDEDRKAIQRRSHRGADHSLIFFVWNGIGKYAAEAAEPIEEERGNYDRMVLFICPLEPGEDHWSRVFAVGSIDQISIGTPEELRETFFIDESDDHFLNLDESRFLAYTKHADRTDLVALHISGLVEPSVELLLWDELGEEQLYYSSMYEQTGMVTTYVSKSTRNNVSSRLQHSRDIPSVPADRERSFKDYDVVICHASEDKETVARPIYEGLRQNGIEAWIDEAGLKVGDPLRESIDRALARCTYGVVILSRQFLEKGWTKRELEGLIAKETVSGKKAILPVWHHLDEETLLQYSPSLAGRVAADTGSGIAAVVQRLVEAMRE